MISWALLLDGIVKYGHTDHFSQYYRHIIYQTTCTRIHNVTNTLLKNVGKNPETSNKIVPPTFYILPKLMFTTLDSVFHVLCKLSQTASCVCVCPSVNCLFCPAYVYHKPISLSAWCANVYLCAYHMVSGVIFPLERGD